MEFLINSRGYPCCILNSKWNNLSLEIDSIEHLIKSARIKSLLIDSYFVTHEYLSRIHSLTHVTYIDDLNAFHYPCSMLINYNYYWSKFNYPSQYPKTKLLLGCRYVPLRAEFQHAVHRKPALSVQSVMITTGGNDIHNFAVKLITEAQKNPSLSGIVFHVISGQFNSSFSKIQALAKNTTGIVVHTQLPCLAPLMTKCDLAVSAGGSTLYELCACSVPTVVFAYADNQLDTINTLGEEKMISAGDLRINETACIEKIIKGLDTLSQNYSLRKEMSLNLYKLVDGNGANRIAHELLTGIT